MKKLMTLICGMLLSASALFASDVYINPGHGDWSATDRPLATVRHAVYDTLGFFESNTNLWKGLYLREQLEAAGLTVTMSRTDCGVGRNKDLDVIAAEAEACGASYFISIHSNANQEPGLTNWPSFFYHSGEGGIRGQSDVMSQEANTAWLEIWTTDVNATDKLEYCTYTSYITGDLRPDDGYYGVLWTAVPGYMAEAYFHTYRPSRHRCLNPDRCCVEGYLYGKAIKSWFDKPASTTGMIYGIVCDAQNDATPDLYLPTQPGWQAKTPLEGVRVQLRTTTGELVTGIDCYPYVARHLTDQAYYTTDDNYNGVFVFKDVAPGNYKMDFLKYGYNDTTINITVTANQVACRVVPMNPGTSTGVFPGAEPGEMHYELNGGTLADSLPLIVTTEIVLPTPVKEGQYFLGWYWTADFSGERETKLVPGSEGTLYARWGDYPLARNAYASSVEMEMIIDGTATISYFLNDEATGVEMLVMSGETVVKTFTFTEPTLFEKGIHLTEVDLSDLAPGEYTWALRVSGGNLPEPLKCSDRTPALNFYWSEGMAINNRSESPYFGQIYVTESWGGKTTNDGKRSVQGLYILNPDLTPNGDVIPGACGGSDIPWIDANDADGNGFFKAIHGPMRVSIDADDYVYVNDDGRWGTQQSSALYRMDPADPSADWVSMLDLNYREGNSAGNTKIFTRINCSAFTGSGDEKEMYIVDWSDDIVKFPVGNATNLHTGRTVWRNLPSGEFSQIPNRTLIPEPLHGGFWMFNFNGGNNAKPAVCHFNASKTCDLKLFGGTDGITDNANGGGAINCAGDRLAFCDGSALRVYAIAYEGTVPTLTLLYRIAGISASSSLAFDVADNLYCASSATQYLEVFALPREEASCTTKAAAPIVVEAESAISIISADAPKVEKIFENNTIYIIRDGVTYTVQGLEVK